MQERQYESPEAALAARAEVAKLANQVCQEIIQAGLTLQELGEMVVDVWPDTTDVGVEWSGKDALDLRDRLMGIQHRIARYGLVPVLVKVTYALSKTEEAAAVEPQPVSDERRWM